MGNPPPSKRSGSRAPKDKQLSRTCGKGGTLQAWFSQEKEKPPASGERINVTPHQEGLTFPRSAARRGRGGIGPAVGHHPRWTPRHALAVLAVPGGGSCAAVMSQPSTGGQSFNIIVAGPVSGDCRLFLSPGEDSSARCYRSTLLGPSLWSRCLAISPQTLRVFIEWTIGSSQARFLSSRSPHSAN